MAEVNVTTWAHALAVDAEPAFAQGVVQDILISDEFSPAVPTVQFSGSKFEWAKELTLGENSSDFAASDASLLYEANAELHRVASTWEKVETKPCRFACYLGTDERIETELSSIFSVHSNNKAGAIKRVINDFLRQRWAVGGSLAGTENRFDTIPDLLDNEVLNPHIREGNLKGPGVKQQTTLGTVEIAGIPYSVTNIDDARFTVKTGPVDCIVQHPEQITMFEKLIRSYSGGMQPYRDFSIPGTDDVINVPQYKGIPFLRCDFNQKERDQYGVPTDARFFLFNLSSPYSIKNITSDTGAIRVRDLGVVNEKLLTQFSQVILVVNQFVPSLRSMAQITYSL